MNQKHVKKKDLKREKIKYHPSRLNQIVDAIYGYYGCDKSQHLKKTEFTKVLTKLVKDMGGNTPSIEEIEDIMFQLDVNGDGQISKEEFKMLIHNIIELSQQNNCKPRFITSPRNLD